VYKTGRFPYLVAFTLLLVIFLAAACKQPFSQQPVVTNTPIQATSLFETPIGETPGITMSDVANFGTTTALALSGTPQAAATQTLSIGTQSINASMTPTALVPSNPALTLVQTSSSQTYSQVGETITFTYIVTNAGGAPLGPVQLRVSDSQLGSFDCGPPDIVLPPLQSLTCSASYVITQNDLGLANITSRATVSGGGQTSAQAAATVTNLSMPGTPMPDVTPTPDGTATNAPIPPGADVSELVATAVGSFPASYDFLVPFELRVNESFIVELYMSRSFGEAELSTQIVTANALATSTSQAGTLVAPSGEEVWVGSGQVEATENMLVELKSENPQAFEIVSWNGDGIKTLNTTTPAIWRWQITAKQEGKQALILLIYQQTKVHGRTEWPTLPKVRRVVQVDVPIGQRLAAHWELIAGTLITLLAISALWHGVNLIQKQSKPPERSRYRRGEGSRQATRQKVLNRLPGFSLPHEAERETVGNIFISYRRSDSADIAGRIYDRLIEEFGQATIFKDVDSIPLGVDFKRYLDQKVSECNVLLAIIGDRWVDATDATGQKRIEDRADFVRLEIESALKRDIPVIPLLVRGAQMPVEEDLPYSLRRLVFKNGIQIRPDPDFHRDVDRLISALNDHMR
jgi:uncharacterized repeat protein (TIGR01451 family)